MRKLLIKKDGKYYVEFYPDELQHCKQKGFVDLLIDNITMDHIFYTTNYDFDKDLKILKKYFNYMSGPIAVKVLAQLKNEDKVNLFKIKNYKRFYQYNMSKFDKNYNLKQEHVDRLKELLRQRE